MDCLAWVCADAWYRRDLGNGTYLVVSRTTTNADTRRGMVGSDRDARWSWHQYRTTTGGLLASGPRKKHYYSTAQSAMERADQFVSGYPQTGVAA